MEAVIIEVCTVQVLRLRADPWQIHEMEPMVKQDFTLTKLTCRLHFCPNLANVPGALICTAEDISTVNRTRESSGSVACYQIDMWGVPLSEKKW